MLGVQRDLSSISIETRSSLPLGATFEADCGRTQQILLNILKFSFKHAQHDDKITMWIKTDREISEQQEGQNFLVTIAIGKRQDPADVEGLNRELINGAAPE